MTHRDWFNNALNLIELIIKADSSSPARSAFFRRSINREGLPSDGYTKVTWVHRGNKFVFCVEVSPTTQSGEEQIEFTEIEFSVKMRSRKEEPFLIPDSSLFINGSLFLNDLYIKLPWMRKQNGLPSGFTQLALFWLDFISFQKWKRKIHFTGWRRSFW